MQLNIINLHQHRRQACHFSYLFARALLLNFLFFSCFKWPTLQLPLFRLANCSLLIVLFYCLLLAFAGAACLLFLLTFYSFIQINWLANDKINPPLQLKPQQITERSGHQFYLRCEICGGGSGGLSAGFAPTFIFLVFRIFILGQLHGNEFCSILALLLLLVI